MIRLLLAMLVIYSHTGLGGFVNLPLVNNFPFPSSSISSGHFAVAGFFALSGYVVTLTANQRQPGYFILSRFLRIWPGLFVALVMTSFLFLPLMLAIQGRLGAEYWTLEPGGPVSYVLRNMTLPLGLQFGVLGEPKGVPYEGTINGSLWTLPLEVRAYVFALLLVLIGKVLGAKRVFLTSLVGIGFLIFARNTQIDASAALGLGGLNLELLFVFLSGGALALMPQKVRVNRWTVLVFSSVLLIGFLLTNHAMATICLSSLALLIPAAATLGPKNLPSLFSNDYSFGSYIYAFPVQQLLAATNLFNDSPSLYFVSSTALTLCFAVPSWHFIEKPVMRVKVKWLDSQRLTS